MAMITMVMATGYGMMMTMNHDDWDEGGNDFGGSGDDCDDFGDSDDGDDESMTMMTVMMVTYGDADDVYDDYGYGNGNDYSCDGGDDKGNH